MPRTAAVAVCLLIAWPAAGQSTYTPEMLRDLPAGGNLFALLEAAQPEITTDRFNSGGLNGGIPERVSAFLASWTQTQYRLGDVTISSPVDGSPMLFPELAWWSRIDMDASRLSASAAAAGLTIDLTPRAAAGRWSWTVESLGAGGALSEKSASSFAPAVSTLNDSLQMSAVASGYAMGDRLGLTIGAARSRATTLERDGERRQANTSMFVNSSYVLSQSRRITALALLQADARHWQAAYQHSRRARFFAGFTSRETGRVTTSLPAVLQVDRLYDGPIPSLIRPHLAEHRAVIGWRLVPAIAASRHSISGGADIERMSSSTAPIPLMTIAERVGGVAARTWIFRSPDTHARRRAISAAAFVQDRIALSPSVTAEGALRFETTDARAAGGATAISWRAILPAVHFEWNAGTFLNLEFLTGVSRHADQARLDWLAHGDPNAPTATVFPWAGDGSAGVPGSPIMRVGPGTGGDASFSAIDPELRVPITDQFILQVAANPWPSFRLRVTGLARRQSSLIGVVNTGAPASAYTMFTIPDPNADWVHPKDDQQLPVYERRRETFTQDRYELTNPDVEDATMGAVAVAAEVQKPRFTFRIGGTASASVGSGGNRGYTAVENDQSVLGELFTNPNAATNARGRLFTDRAYTIKTMGIVRLPAQFTVGAIGRFQDGQPFTRLVIVPVLNQGAEAIQAFPRGRSRFSYRATLDLRVQKRFDKSMLRFELIADAYNLLQASSEVEEYVLTDARFREITAVQPPRSIHLGARVTF